MATIAEHFGRSDWFTPSAESETGRIFAAMEDTADGVTLTYEDLDRILGRDFKSNRAPWLAALRRWHRDHPGEGTFVNVQRIGYQRRSDWDGAKSAGKHHELKMRRQAKRSKQRYSAADQSKMTDPERNEQTELLVRIGRLEAAMRSTKRDVTALRREKADVAAVDDLRQQVAALSEAVGKLAK